MPRYSIIGSCVSRDILESIKDVPGVEIGRYVGRTSIASVNSKPWLAPPQLTYSDKVRPWHRKMIANDFGKTHVDYFAEMRPAMFCSISLTSAADWSSSNPAITCPTAKPWPSRISLKSMIGA